MKTMALHLCDGGCQVGQTRCQSRSSGAGGRPGPSTRGGSPPGPKHPTQVAEQRARRSPWPRPASSRWGGGPQAARHGQSFKYSEMRPRRQPCHQVPLVSQAPTVCPLLSVNPQGHPHTPLPTLLPWPLPALSHPPAPSCQPGLWPHTLPFLSIVFYIRVHPRWVASGAGSTHQRYCSVPWWEQAGPPQPVQAWLLA